MSILRFYLCRLVVGPMFDAYTSDEAPVEATTRAWQTLDVFGQPLFRREVSRSSGRALLPSHVTDRPTQWRKRNQN
jgi:hypothetical protein